MSSKPEKSTMKHSETSGQTGRDDSMSSIDDSQFKRPFPPAPKPTLLPPGMDTKPQLQQSAPPIQNAKSISSMLFTKNVAAGTIWCHLCSTQIKACNPNWLLLHCALVHQIGTYVCTVCKCTHQNEQELSDHIGQNHESMEASRKRRHLPSYKPEVMVEKLLECFASDSDRVKMDMPESDQSCCSGTEREEAACSSSSGQDILDNRSKISVGGQSAETIRTKSAIEESVSPAPQEPKPLLGPESGYHISQVSIVVVKSEVQSDETAAVQDQLMSIPTGQAATVVHKSDIAEAVSLPQAAATSTNETDCALDELKSFADQCTSMPIKTAAAQVSETSEGKSPSLSSNLTAVTPPATLTPTPADPPLSSSSKKKRRTESSAASPATTSTEAISTVAASNSPSPQPPIASPSPQEPSVAPKARRPSSSTPKPVPSAPMVRGEEDVVVAIPSDQSQRQKPTPTNSPELGAIPKIDQYWKRIRPMANEGTLHCSKCNTKVGAVTKLLVVKHVLQHMKSNFFKCQFEKCLESFPTKENIENHVVTHFSKIKSQVIKSYYQDCAARDGEIARMMEKYFAGNLSGQKTSERETRTPSPVRIEPRRKQSKIKNIRNVIDELEDQLKSKLVDGHLKCFPCETTSFKVMNSKGQFVGKYLLTEHACVHADVPFFTCLECRRPFKYYSDRKRHSRRCPANKATAKVRFKDNSYDEKYRDKVSKSIRRCFIDGPVSSG